MVNIEDIIAQAQGQMRQPQKESIFYIHKEVLNNEVRGFNVLSCLETVFPRNNQGLMFISFKKQIALPQAPYSIILQVLLEGIANMGHSAVIID